MSMVCSKCKGVFEQRIYCPKCHVHLNYQAKGSKRPWFGGAPWQQTPWGRVLLGLALAQGLYYCLRRVVTASALATGGDGSQTMWATLGGLLIIQSMQLGALLLGSMLAGAGQRQGMIYGTVLGVWNGVLTLILYPDHSGQALIATYGQPLLQAAFGGLGGWLGSFIWKPLAEPTSNRNVPEPPKKEKRKIEKPRMGLMEGPLYWARILTGATVAVGGTIWADTILDLVEQAGGGDINISTHLQAQLVTWEITALAMLGGAALAGATTFNGFKQGLAVGVAAAVALVGFRVAQGQPTFEIMVLTSFSPLILGMIGGTFGSQLLPPLAKNPPQRLSDPA